MNIFVLDENPVLAAQYQCNKHVVKMPTESTQMICTVARLNDTIVGYNVTHIRHPCVQWIASNKQRWQWHVEYTHALFAEYTHRYKKIHKAQSIFLDAIEQYPGPSKDGDLKPFVQCIPERLRMDDAVLAYRACYMIEKRHFAAWQQAPPAWFV